MNSKYVENITLEEYQSRGGYTPAKKIDMGNFYLIYVSGIQAPKNDDNEVVASEIEEQTTLVFEEIDAILRQAGASLDNIVKSVIYLTDMNDFDKFSKIRSEFFKNSLPVSTLVEVNGMTRKGAKIEIEVTAILEK